MPNCERCKYAIWDYELYYGEVQKDWFVDGCEKDMDEPEEGHECFWFKEVDDADTE